MARKFYKELTAEFRVSYPSVFEPSGYEDQEKKYQITCLWPKGSNLDNLKKMLNDVARDMWGDKIPKNLKSPFHDGNEKVDELGEVRPGYKDVTWARLTSKKQPGLVDAKVKRIINPEDFYGGCYAVATVSAYAYDRSGNKGVAFGLLNIQKTRDGEPFGSSNTKIEDDFTPIIGNDDDMPF